MKWWDWGVQCTLRYEVVGVTQTIHFVYTNHFVCNIKEMKWWDWKCTVCNIKEMKWWDWKCTV
jgi:hypothetical protein